MLWLPKGIWAWYQKKAIEADVSLGVMLIQLACKQAWIDGYKCQGHIPNMKTAKADGKMLGTGKRALRKARCKRCGMMLTHEMAVRGAPVLVKAEYESVGVVDKSLIDNSGY